MNNSIFQYLPSETIISNMKDLSIYSDKKYCEYEKELLKEIAELRTVYATNKNLDTGKELNEKISSFIDNIEKKNLNILEYKEICEKYILS